MSPWNEIRLGGLRDETYGRGGLFGPSTAGQPRGQRTRSSKRGEVCTKSSAFTSHQRQHKRKQGTRSQTLHLEHRLLRCSIGTDMTKPFHKIRSRYFRLLASTLVMLAILSNGIALAQTDFLAAEKDCCAEMMNGNMSSDDMSDKADSCPSSDNTCDDQCMARCLNANGLLSVQLVIAPSIFVMTALPQLKMAEHSLAEIGPGLRPPIFA